VPVHLSFAAVIRRESRYIQWNVYVYLVIVPKRKEKYEYFNAGKIVSFFRKAERTILTHRKNLGLSITDMD